MAVRFCRTDPTGNIFYILGRASSEMKHSGIGDKTQEMFDRVKASGSYEEALKIVGEYVELAEVEA